MTTLKLFLVSTFFLLLYTGCKKDNYTAPNSGIYGKLTDGETGDSLQLKQPGGGTVRMVEFNPAKYPSPTPIDLSVKPNGSYSASQLFADAYKVFPLAANGPFLYLPGDSVLTTLNPEKMTQLDFKVVPFYRLTLSVTDSSFTYTVTKSNANTGTLSQVILMISSDPIVNENVCANQNGPNPVNLWKLNVSDAILGVPQTYTIHFAITKLAKGDYYFRAGAVGSTSSSYYNYSPTIKATVH